MGEWGRAADRTGFSKANLVNSSSVSWSGSIDPIAVLHLVRYGNVFETECTLSSVLPHASSQKDDYVTQVLT